MEANTPFIFIDGIDQVIRKDLQKHKDMLLRAKERLIVFRTAVSHQVKKKRHYKSLIGGGKFDDEALRNSMSMIAVDIRHMSDKVKLTEEEIAHHTLIVDTLTGQLDDYAAAKQDRDRSLHASANRLVQ